MLETKLCCILTEHSAPLAMQKDPDRSKSRHTASTTPSRIPAAAVRKLGLTLDRLAANVRLSYCTIVYADARGDTVSARLHALGLDYLQDQTQVAQALSPNVKLWGRHLEFVVRHLLEAE
ncbi:exocyst complex component EXO70A1-like [Hordeum vulgare]|nr:exocyst complex component EXO70A1-like [Hordeum vulgare]